MFKLSNISGKKRAPMPESSSDGSSDEDDEEDNDKHSRPSLEVKEKTNKISSAASIEIKPFNLPCF